MGCPICEGLKSRLAAAQMDLENARVWLRSFALETDAAAYGRVRVMAEQARLELFIAQRELEAHERTHREFGFIY